MRWKSYGKVKGESKMNHIDEKISYIKTNIQQTKIPDDLETMLESKLNEVETKKSNFTRIVQYASVVLAVILLALTSYNYQSLDYYSKKILGFDEFYGAVGILNEAEKGQIIDKTIELEEGLTFTVNGIM